MIISLHIRNRNIREGEGEVFRGICRPKNGAGILEQSKICNKQDLSLKCSAWNGFLPSLVSKSLNFGTKRNFGSNTKFHVQKKFVSKKNLGRIKNSRLTKTSRSKNIWSERNVLSKKNSGSLYL